MQVKNSSQQRFRRYLARFPIRLNALRHQAQTYFSGLNVMPPIFVVGCGHSGTSLLLAMLDNHTKITAIAGESCVFLRSIRRKLRFFYAWDRRVIKLRTHRWAEKTPIHIHCIDCILDWFPQAHVLIMLRDGRDVACSIKMRKGSFWLGVNRWINDNKKGQEYWSLPNVLIVKYEELVASPQQSMEKILQFIDERPEPGILEMRGRNRQWYSCTIERPSDVRSNHEQFRNWQINQALFNGSGRWHKEMNEGEKELFKELAGHKLVEYGYATDSDW